MRIFEVIDRYEIPALIDWYTEGGCLTFAFAVSWMTGWPVQGVSEQGGETFLHFAAIGPDGLAWDASGPRDLAEAGSHYANDPIWEPVNVYKFITTSEATESDITEAAEAALAIFGPRIVPHVKQRPKGITESVMAHLPSTPENIQRAKSFLLQKWRERAQEGGHPEPVDLSSACKFVSMFAQRVFGGQLRGNWHHQYLLLPQGERLDLTEPSEELARMSRDGVDPYSHDRRFWNNREHKESLISCEARVNRWVQDFLGKPM